MTIVFEQYTPTQIEGDGSASLPALRAYGTTEGAYFGRGVLPGMVQYAYMGSLQPQALPALRTRASTRAVGGGAGYAELPAKVAFGDASSTIPQITFGYGVLPLLSGSGTAHFEMQSDGSTSLPPLHARALIDPTAAVPTFGIASVPGKLAFGYFDTLADEGWISVLQSPGIAYMAGDANAIALMNDALVMSSVARAQWVQVLQDVVVLGSSRSALFNVIQVLSDDVIFGDALTLILRELLADTLTVSSTPSSWMGVALALLDTVRLGSAPAASYDAHTVLLLGFALGSVLFDAQRGYLSDDVALADALIQKVNALALLADSWQLASTQTSSAILYALLSDSATFSDTRTDYLAITQALLDGAQFGLTLYTGQDQYVAWVMTTPTRAMRRYVNYPFNSFGEINGRLCGANASGLYWLDGDTDDGTEIPSMIRSGLMDFGSRQLKRMDRAYMGYTSDGTLGLKVITTSETGDEVAYSYKMVQKPTNAPRESRVQIGRGMRSVYWQFELINEAGSDFELHDLTLLPLVLSRRVS